MLATPRSANLFCIRSLQRPVVTVPDVLASARPWVARDANRIKVIGVFAPCGNTG